MPPKRQNESRGADELSGRERKKQKMTIARTIAVQSDAGPSNGTPAGPPKSVRFDSMKGLPGALDVERFAESRAFEINAMHEAMQNARNNSTQRAWQQLPRHLRRRAASHDVRRVPLRLRDKAQAEMDPARKASGHSKAKLGKLKKTKRTTALLRRQKDKTWLETHIWHSKRMHMKTMWGYRLAVTPTEKSFRPSHRASVHGSILHDASYFATIEIKGPEDILRTTLDSCCDCQGPGAGVARFISGARSVETHLYGYNKYPYNLIGPATILWHADPQEATKQPAAVVTKGKGNLTEKDPPVLPCETNRRVRTVWVRVHPSITAEAHEALRLSGSFALDAVKQTRGNAEVEIADLREHFNVFEIMGPKASQVIKGALKPVDDERKDFKKFWDSLSRLQTTGSVPRGMVVGLTVHDPRLNFPPKNAKLNVEEGHTLSPASAVFPSAALAQSQIWNEAARMVLRKPRYKKKDLDQRRSNNLVPGTPLKSERKDNRIPVLLIQRSVENAASSQSSQSPRLSNTTALHGWTLIVPQGWGMPFLSSLIYTGTRVGGQSERRTQAFEAGCTYFPWDVPTTEAYESHADEMEDDDRQVWDRKPPAKRPNYDKLGTRSPWRADWGVVLGLEEPPRPQELEEFVDTQRVNVDALASVPGTTDGGGTKNLRQWLLRGQDVSHFVADVRSMLNPAAGMLVRINQQRSKRKLDPLDVTSCAEDLVRGALVQVSISVVGRGCPDDLAVIYRIEDEEAKKWMRAVTKRKSGLSLIEDEPDETELSQISSSSDAIIGYVTTGSFSLSIGEGHAVGAIPFAHYLELRKQAQRLGNDFNLLVKLRNRDETICRSALLELLP